MQKNDRARDDGQKDIVSVPHTPLIHSIIILSVTPRYTCRYKHLIRITQLKNKKKTTWMGNFPTYMVDIVYPAPRLLIWFTIPRCSNPCSSFSTAACMSSFHQRWAQAVCVPPSHYPDRFQFSRQVPGIPDKQLQRSEQLCSTRDAAQIKQQPAELQPHPHAWLGYPVKPLCVDLVGEVQRSGFRPCVKRWHFTVFMRITFISEMYKMLCITVWKINIFIL